MSEQEGPKTDSGFRGTQVRDDGTGPVILEHRHRLLVVEGPDRGLEVEIPRTKLTIPAPAMLHLRGGRRAISREHYPDLAEFWADAAAAYRVAIGHIAAAGCTYLQLDDVSFAYLCDPKVREGLGRKQLQQIGEEMVAAKKKAPKRPSQPSALKKTVDAVIS